METGLGDGPGPVLIRSLGLEGGDQLVAPASGLDLLDGVALAQRALERRLGLALDQAQDARWGLLPEAQPLNAAQEVVSGERRGRGAPGWTASVAHWIYSLARGWLGGRQPDSLGRPRLRRNPLRGLNWGFPCSSPTQATRDQ